MALTQNELDKLIEAEEEHNPPLVMRIFAKALGALLENTEGVVVHIPATDSGDLISCIVFREDTSGTVKIVPDPMYSEVEDGTLVWMHNSKEEAEVATKKQQRSELH